MGDPGPVLSVGTTGEGLGRVAVVACVQAAVRPISAAGTQALYRAEPLTSTGPGRASSGQCRDPIDERLELASRACPDERRVHRYVAASSGATGRKKVSR